MRLRNIVPLTLSALLSTSCSRQSVLNPGGPAARELSDLNWFVIVLFSIIAAVMWILIAFVASRPRGSFREHAPVDAGGGQNWILIGGFAIPAAILAIVFITGLSGMTDFPLHEGHNMRPADILIIGHQWWWEAQYKSGGLWIAPAPNEIHIPVGRPVDIDLQSTDVIHSFWVPELHGKVDLVPTQLNRIRIQADRAGTYRGQCAEYCGAQHAHMILNVVADPPDQYDQWLKHQAAPAAAPVDAQMIEGQRLFMGGPCVVCHTIRGTAAQAHTGPDLTHLASRKYIATNMLENNTANLAAWVTHAQALKPSVVMPNITTFSGPELQALIAYLQSLK
jgi:cytochrome c oxidase subunit 2